MPTLNPGTVLNGRYNIVSLLGEGGMAKVYLAKDLKKGTDVALKILNSDQLSNPKRKVRFLREFTIMSGLDHPGVAKVYNESESEDGVPFFSLEYLKGKTLSERIAESSLATSFDTEPQIQQALELLKRIAQVLVYIHSKKILYCDLKPDNILTVSEGIKLIDFGISARVDQVDDNEERKMLGTSLYMSPEQIRCEQISSATDIYSFGVLAFELFSGKLPYSDPSLFSISAFHLLGKPPSLRSFNKAAPKAIDLMIKICMEKSPANRYQSMQEVLERLEAIG